MKIFLVALLCCFFISCSEQEHVIIETSQRMPISEAYGVTLPIYKDNLQIATIVAQYVKFYPNCSIFYKCQMQHSIDNSLIISDCGIYSYQKNRIDFVGYVFIRQNNTQLEGRNGYLDLTTQSLHNIDDLHVLVNQ